MYGTFSTEIEAIDETRAVLCRDFQYYEKFIRDDFGEVYRDGKLVAHFEYDRILGWACTTMHLHRDGVTANRRSGNYGTCTCGQPPTPVVLYAVERRGFHWDAEACFDRMTITGGLNHHVARGLGKGRPTAAGDLSSGE